MNIFSHDEFEQGRQQVGSIILSKPLDLLFVGGFNHSPNRDAVKWLIRDILPLLRNRESRFVLRIAGSNPPREISLLAGPGVEVLGRVSDDELLKLYATSAVALAPLRYGAGVKGKVIEAFARGTPVVSTMVGLQGIEAPQEIAFIGDNASAFANSILLAMHDRELAAAKALRALQFVRERYSAKALRTALAPYIVEFQNRSIAAR